ncbi:helix-turn-helix domain-containing protein [Candidatus Pacearchaeota archaeon]|nr:helix-turn-helix domain-containing protein [Candidatus Pacearchaeota archaeon]
METYTQKERKILEVLEFIGLHKNERIIYLDLIKNGSSTALEVSKRTKIHRPNTYDALRKLLEKGFISQVKNISKTLFQAMDPNKIHTYIEQKKQEVNSILPDLKELTNVKQGKEGVSISEGVFAARNALLDLLELNSEIKIYGASKQALETFGFGFLADFHMKRIKKKIHMRHIYNHDAWERIKKLNRMKYTQARHLSKYFDSPVSTNICGDTVIFIIFSNPVAVITIKKIEVAESYGKYYEILWSRSKSN